LNIRLGAKGLECSDLLLREIDIIAIKSDILDQTFANFTILVSLGLHLDVLGFGLV